MKFFPIAIAIVILLAAALYGFETYTQGEKQSDSRLFSDYKKGTYMIADRPVQLGTEGVAYFGNEVMADFDGDGDQDVAFLITEQPGGSGTFFYLVGAINEDGTYRGTQAMLIGDRIAPQTTEFKNGLVIVNYADRGPTEPMSTKPTFGKSLYAKYSTATNDFGEVVQNFEGESR